MSTDTKHTNIGLDIEKVSGSSISTDANADADAQRLQELGYKQEFTREISLFVQAGFSFSTMAVLSNWLIGFGSSMAAGGPSSLFWGYVVLSPFIMCMALSMAEIFSAFPVNGGVYSWCYQLSSKEWGPLMAWICGYMFVAGLLTGTMTLAYSMGEYMLSIINVMRPDNPITSPGANVGLFVLFLVLGAAWNSLGLRFSSYLNKFMVFWVLIGTVIVVVTMPAMAPTHPTAKWVFTEFLNRTGYKSNGFVFFLGLLQAGWTLLGYECGAQISEGTKDAAVSGPRGIVIAVTGAIVQGLILCIATLFSIQDVEELQMSQNPLATLFLRATNNKSVAAFLLSILFVTQFGSLVNINLACAQMMWAMARDNCLPQSKFWYKLHDKTKAPVRILILICVVATIVIMPTFGSQVYWSAIMSTSVMGVSIAYGLPNLCRVIWSRNTMPKGPFDLGRWSLPINIIAVLWVTFFSVILCFPVVTPVTPEVMNWSSLMIGGTLIFCLILWYFSGRHHYKGPSTTAE